MFGEGREMMKVSCAIGAICVAAVTALASGAQAQTTVGEAWDTCQNSDDSKDADTVIAACTAMINSGYGDANLRSAAFGYRAIAYEQKDQDDLAAADYRQALQLNPNNQGAELGLKSVTQ
jgi:hypothetical protein